MKTRIEIDIRYLGKNDLARFLKIREIVETSYREALSSLSVYIPYIPKLYIIPFLQRIVSEGKQKFVWNALGSDPWEPTKLAIFPSLPFLERVSQKHIVTSLAHELAHLLDATRTPSLHKRKKKDSIRKIDIEMEKRARTMFQHFKEPLRSWLLEMEATPRDPDFVKTITFNAFYQTFTSYDQFDRYLKSKSSAHTQKTRMKAQETSKLEILVDELIQETNELLSTTIEKTKSSDDRSRQQKSKWTERHRLHVLLEAAKETQKSLPKAIVAPWFLAELKATLKVVRRWRDKPIWKEIEPSLVNPTHFTHTIAKLHIAEHLMSAGHKVEIVPRGENASPDLKVQAIGGTQDWIHIECYQPTVLNGKPSNISAEEAENIVKQSMSKAKRQLGKKTPGILAICGYNQSKTNLENLRQAVESRLRRTTRLNLCGILLVTLGIVYRKNKDETSFTPTISVEFVDNPSYFGRVDISSSTPKDDVRLIKEHLIDISTESLYSHKTDSLSERGFITSKSTSKTNSENIREERLSLIEEPAPKSRAVIHSQSNSVLPLFKGQGNINYLCGRCEAILAERVWKLSISNLVVKCPSCQSYNDFPNLDIGDYPVKGRIAFAKQNFPLSQAIMLKQGVCLVGL